MDGKVTVESRTSPDFDPCHLMFISEYPLRSTFALEIVRRSIYLRKKNAFETNYFVLMTKQDDILSVLAVALQNMINISLLFQDGA